MAETDADGMTETERIKRCLVDLKADPKAKILTDSMFSFAQAQEISAGLSGNLSDVINKEREER